MKNKIIGVLGGMGPHASNRFMELLYSCKNYKEDKLYPRVILDSNTKIPSRTRSIIFKEKSPIKGMIQTANQLKEYGANAIALPCNTAHIWINQLQKNVKIPIFDLTNLVSKEVISQCSNEQINVYIFGTTLTTKKKLYIKKLSKIKKINLIKISKNIQNKIENLIYLIKKNNFKNKYKSDFKIILKSLKFKKQKNLIILACTELSYFKDIKFKNIKLIDSNTVLAKTAFDYYENKFDFFENENFRNFWSKRSKSLKNSKIGTLQSTMLTNNENYAKNKDNLEKKNVIKKVKKFILNKSVLEAGCGTGRWTSKFLKYANSIDAYEKDSQLIKYAMEKYGKNKKVNFINKSITNINLKKKFDVIISIALLHYLNNKEYNSFFDNIKKISRKNSILIFRESMSIEYDFELFMFYSKILKTQYSAHYRSIENIKDKLGKQFALIDEHKIFNPEIQKPETYQNLVIFRKTA